MRVHTPTCIQEDTPTSLRVTILLLICPHAARIRKTRRQRLPTTVWSYEAGDLKRLRVEQGRSNDCKNRIPQFVACTFSKTMIHWRGMHYLLTYLLAYLLTTWSRVLDRLTNFQPVKKFPAFHGTRKFITAFTSARHLSLSWACSIQSIPPHPTSWRFFLILSSHLRLVLPRGFFPSGFPTKTLYTPLLSPSELHAPPISFFSTLSHERYWVRSTDHWAPHYVVFSTTLSPCSS